MKKQVTVQDLMKAFRGMFPQELHKVLTTNEKYFGFRIEGNRTKFVLNSREFEGKYTKHFIGSELRQLIEKFLKYKVCCYDCSQIPSVAKDEAIVQGTGLKDSYMLENCTPVWLTIEKTLDLFKNTSELFWLLRYRKFKYRWCNHDDGQWFVSEYAHTVGDCLEFPHTQAVLMTLINEGKIEKPQDPSHDK